MKKIILTIAVTALTLTLVAQTQAGPKSGGSNKSSGSKVQNVANSKITPVKTGGPQTKLNQGTSAKFKDYNLKFGTKFQYGTFYKGKHHEHWGQIRFDPRYGCDCYWDPCTLVWYYWCERDFCYYPVSYCPYRCYVCIEVVVETAIPSVPLTNAPNLVIPPSTPASPVNDIPPIPVPVAPRPE